MTRATLSASGLHLSTPEGRALLRDSSFAMGRERVALVGRNGVGKSTWLSVLAGARTPEKGCVHCSGSLRWVPQDLLGTGSPGEVRQRHLRAAMAEPADFLLLDEPTRDLDEGAVAQLLVQLRAWPSGLLVASHDSRLLGEFRQFCVMEESGCWAFEGSASDLAQEMERRAELANRKFVAELSRLSDREWRTERDMRRRERKRRGGRVRELARCPARVCLNAKRGYAQKSQARRRLLQEERSERARQWAQVARRALRVELPLSERMPVLPPPGDPLLEATGVQVSAGERVLFASASVRWVRERWGIVGPNGCGKSTLLEALLGRRALCGGRSVAHTQRLGVVLQQARDWCVQDSLVELLLALQQGGASWVAEELASHRFPFALAERPLATLSPGERTRAALICLMARRPAVEGLVLDEPTDALDFAGVAGLRRALTAWPGGLLIVSHDRRFLEALCTDGVFELSTHTLRPLPSKSAGV